MVLWKIQEVCGASNKLFLIIAIFHHYGRQKTASYRIIHVQLSTVAVRVKTSKKWYSTLYSKTNMTSVEMNKLHKLHVLL